MKIIAAAIRFQMVGSDHWQIMTARRHCDVYEQMFKLGIQYNKLTYEDGFITDDFRFLNRYDAIDYAKDSGQLSKDFSNTILFSEDLW